MKKTRRAVQFVMLAVVLVGVFALGAHCERWCPFGGVEAAYTYAAEGNMLCSLGTSNFFILGGVLLSVILLRRAFCGYLCPIGTISEWMHGLGRRMRLPSFTVGGRTDRVLAGLKYIVLAVILYATWQAGELLFRGYDPCYALISRHGADITYWAYVVSGAIVVVSLVVTVPFCRWFCPLAAVLNPLSRFGLTRVQRDGHTCTNCGLCSKNCPEAIPVARLEQVTAARCVACLNCVASCPVNKDGRRALHWGPKGSQWTQAALLALLFLCIAGAVASSYIFPAPSFIKARGARPEQVVTVRLEIDNLTCRGRANLLFYFMERDDLYEIPGYFKVDAWPGPGFARVDVTYDPTATDANAIKQAITEPYFDDTAGVWRNSPFQIRGYDPFGPDVGQNGP
ncbi:MAG: 4Fe-4S binding protein [Pirellulales bacterium]|nr:4Fe-4S binding protein [Pirellulales bacterium]